MRRAMRSSCGRSRSARSLLAVALLGLIAAAALGIGAARLFRPSPARIQGVSVVARLPHDPEAYTQGLLFHAGRFYESTGRHGVSSLREVDPASGEVLRRADLSWQLFGEGLALHGSRLYQATWETGELRVYDLATFEYLRSFRYEGEGWGLAAAGDELALSDGTDLLRFLDPRTGNEVRRVEVRDEGRAVTRLNELELVEGELWANVWKTEWIARIDPASGEVVGWIDLRGLYPYERLPDPEAVPNGIAYDPDERRLFLTGKLWPVLFEVELAPVK
ncbi:MAG: glutaminyl-peptide cyclotransferase [Planctomycetota bacterium]